VLVANKFATANTKGDANKVVRHAVIKLPPSVRRHETWDLLLFLPKLTQASLSLLYKLGDHVGVFCHNDATVVNELVCSRVC